MYILHTDTVKQRQYHGTTYLTIVTEKQKTKTLVLPYREPHQRTPGCCLNSCKWLTLAFVCAVQLVILWTYSHDSQINFACALQMFALHLQQTMDVFTSFGAQNAHLFLFSPWPVTVEGPGVCASLTSVAEGSAQGKCWRLWMRGVTMDFPSSSRNSRLWKLFPSFHLGFTAIHATKAL